MVSFLSTLFGCVCLILSEYSIFISIASDDWSYDVTDETGPFYWDESYPACGGSLGSPINLIKQNSLNGFSTYSSALSTFGISVADSSSDSNDNNQPPPQNQPPITTLLDKWDFSNIYTHTFSATNNGHSISLTPIDSNGNEINTKTNGHIARLPNIFSNSVFIDPLLDSSYFCLHSLHFHWGSDQTEGSEHIENNFQYPGEVHFVHYRCDFNDLSDAINSYDTESDEYVLGVVGFWFDHDLVSDQEYQISQRLNDPLEVIKHNIGQLDDVDDVVNLRINLQHMVTSSNGGGVVNNNDNFWYYAGGLTTPGCYEIVRWHMFDKKIQVTNGQLQALRSITSSYNGQNLIRNFRPVASVTNTGNVYYFDFDLDR